MSFLNDLFDEASTTALSSHTPNPGPGGSWSAMQTVSGGSANPMRIPAGAGYAEAYSGDAWFRNSAAPPTADYYVEAVVERTGFSGYNNGPMGRFTSQGTFYHLRLNEYQTRLELVRVNAWAETLLGSYAWSPSNGTYTFKLQMVGAAIKGYLDGVERISATDGSPISSAGYAGIALGGLLGHSIDAVNLGATPKASFHYFRMAAGLHF